MSNTTLNEMDDFGQPLRHPAILYFRLSTLDRMVRPGGFLIPLLTGVVSIALLHQITETTFWMRMAIAFLVIHFVQQMWFRPRKANMETVVRNKDLYEQLYNQTGSNRWSEVMLGIAATGKFDFYSRSVPETIKSLKDFMKTEHNMGSNKCYNGHHPTCAHKLPSALKKWIND